MRTKNLFSALMGKAALVGAFVAAVAVTSCKKDNDGGGNPDPTAGIDFNAGGTYDLGSVTGETAIANLITAAETKYKAADKISKLKFYTQTSGNDTYTISEVFELDKAGKKMLSADYFYKGTTDNIGKMTLSSFKYTDNNMEYIYDLDKDNKASKFKRSTTWNVEEWSNYGYFSDYELSNIAWSKEENVIVGTKNSSGFGESNDSEKYEITLTADGKYKSIKRSVDGRDRGTTKYAYDAAPKLLAGSTGDYTTVEDKRVIVEWKNNPENQIDTIMVNGIENEINLYSGGISFTGNVVGGVSKGSSGYLSAPYNSGKQVTSYTIGGTPSYNVSGGSDTSFTVTAPVAIEAVWEE